MRHSLILVVWMIWGALAIPSRADTSALTSSPEPFRNGIDALARVEFDDAVRWFAMTHRDFPATDAGRKALVHHTLLLISKELAWVRLASLHHESGDRWDTYVLSARDILGNLKRLTPDLLALPSAEMRLTYSIGPRAWDAGDVAERAQRGDALSDTEKKKLETTEWVKNYAGLLGAVLGVPDGELSSGSYDGTVRPAALFNAVGARLFIGSRSQTDAEGEEKARLCFERVVKLTESTPYARERIVARDFMDKITKEKGVSPGPRCSRCARTMERDWKYCPHDGALLKKP